MLTACLDALAAQRGAPAYEVVVVDDGSTDGSGDLARQHPSRPRVVTDPTARLVRGARHGHRREQRCRAGVHRRRLPSRAGLARGRDRAPGGRCRPGRGGGRRRDRRPADPLGAVRPGDLPRPGARRPGRGVRGDGEPRRRPPRARRRRRLRPAAAVERRPGVGPAGDRRRPPPRVRAGRPGAPPGPAQRRRHLAAAPPARRRLARPRPAGPSPRRLARARAADRRHVGWPRGWPPTGSPVPRARLVAVHGWAMAARWTGRLLG